MNVSKNTDGNMGKRISETVVSLENQEMVSTLQATPIYDPDAEYLNETTKIDISGLTNGDYYASITDGILTVDFSNSLRKEGPVPQGWSTWSSPPFSEDSNPDVLVSEAASLTMELSEPVKTFGFELEPNPFAAYFYTADFFRGLTLVESISRQVHGDSGARLFARTGEPFDRVEVTGPVDFAIAQVRYQQEPSNLFLIVVVLLLIFLLGIILL